jgi:hypothetical protein
MTEHVDDAREDGTRTVMSLSTGARVGIVLALVLLVGAGYLLWSPIQLYPASGFPIMCGTGVVPPADDLGTAACGEVNVIRQWQAGRLAAAAALVALGSIYAFGVRRRRERLIGSDRPSSRTRRDRHAD